MFPPAALQEAHRRPGLRDSGDGGERLFTWIGRTGR
jgi:hypothetical protein